MMTNLRLLLVILLIFTVSCNDNFLERKPLDSMSEEDVWIDPNLIEFYVNNTYAAMINGFTNGTPAYVGFYMALCDEAYRRGNQGAIYETLLQGQLTPSNMAPLNLWPYYYAVITNCNIFLENMADKEFNTQVQPRTNRMKGEMKFLRAYAYSKLISLYGGVPLITKPFRLDDDFLIPRNSYDDCVEFIVNELNEAAALLSISYSGTDIGRATRGAALAIKSRVLLYAASQLNNPNNDRGKWQQAADAAKAVIDMGVYDLYPSYKETFTVPYNSEVIWVRPFNNRARVEHSLEQWFYPNGSTGYGQIHPTHNATEFFEMKETGLLPKDDPAYNPENPYADRDPRFYDCILFDGAPWQDREIETFLPGGLDSNEGPEGWNATLTGYYPRKFVDESIWRPTANNCSNTHWVYIRYGEILLNYAEAMYYLGNEDECRKYLNLIRDRLSVQMPHITDSGSQLELRVRNERYVELFFEEHRFFDVRRWRIATQTENIPAFMADIRKDPDTGEKTYNFVSFQERIFLEHNYVAPIPQGEIDKNPNLKQNTGY